MADSEINHWQTSILSAKILSTSLSARSGLFHCPPDLVYFTVRQIWSTSLSARSGLCHCLPDLVYFTVCQIWSSCTCIQMFPSLPPSLPHTASHSAGTKMKLLEQPIPASFLQLEEKVRVIATRLKRDMEPPLMKENRFREETSDIIANPRQLDQAVTFLHENGREVHSETGVGAVMA